MTRVGRPVGPLLSDLFRWVPVLKKPDRLHLWFRSCLLLRKRAFSGKYPSLSSRFARFIRVFIMT